MQNSEKFSGWQVLVGCFLIMFFVQGGLQTLAVFLPAIAKGLDVHIGVAAMISTFATIAAFAANLLIAPMLNRTTIRRVLFIGLILCSGHFYLYSMAENITVIYLGAAMGGFSAGFGTIAPCSMIMTNWFIKKRATYMSIIVAGSMFGGALLMPVCGWLIDQWGWRHAYIILASVIGVVGILAIGALISDSPAEKGQKAYGADEVVQTTTGKSSAELGGLTASEAKKTLSFWLLALGILLIGCSTNIENFLPAFWQSRGLTVVNSSNLMGLYAFIAGVVAMVLGRITDKLGGKAYGLLTSAMFILGSIMIVFIGAAAMPLMVLALIPFSMGAKKTSIMTAPLVVAESFGRKNYASIVGNFTAVLQLGIALSNPIIGAILRTEGGYTSAFYAMAGINLVAVLLLVFALKISPYKA